MAKAICRTCPVQRALPRLRPAHPRAPRHLGRPQRARTRGWQALTRREPAWGRAGRSGRGPGMRSSPRRRVTPSASSRARMASTYLRDDPRTSRASATVTDPVLHGRDDQVAGRRRAPSRPRTTPSRSRPALPGRAPHDRGPDAELGRRRRGEGLRRQGGHQPAGLGFVAATLVGAARRARPARRPGPAPSRSAAPAGRVDRRAAARRVSSRPGSRGRSRWCGDQRSARPEPRRGRRRRPGIAGPRRTAGPAPPVAGEAAGAGRVVPGQAGQVVPGSHGRAGQDPLAERAAEPRRGQPGPAAGATSSTTAPPTVSLAARVAQHEPVAGLRAGRRVAEGQAGRSAAVVAEDRARRRRARRSRRRPSGGRARRRARAPASSDSATSTTRRLDHWSAAHHGVAPAGGRGGRCRPG